MNVIKANLNNFLMASTLLEELNKHCQFAEITPDFVLKSRNDEFCPMCGNKMVLNGQNKHGNIKLGKIKVQRYRCNTCKINHEISSELIGSLIKSFFRAISHLILVMRNGYLSFELIAEALSTLIEISSDTVHNIYKTVVDNSEVPVNEDVMFYHYDEQYPKEGRLQKYRLSLFNGNMNTMASEEITEKLNPEIVEDFLNRHLPKDRLIFLVTDMSPMYNDIMDRIRPGYLIHQHCLLHLNKRVVNDFHNNCSLSDELVKYELLNIFYDRTSELKYLKDAKMIEEIYLANHDLKSYYKWLLDERKNFHIFVHDLEKARRRTCKRDGIPNRMKMWSLTEARNNLDMLLNRRNEFSLVVNKRIQMIKSDWSRLTAFYNYEGAPATNNAIENYYSCSCKQIKKKQHRRNTALKRQWKLYAMKRAGMLRFEGRPLFETIAMLWMIGSGI
jgi:transposase-like protein